MKLKNQVSRNTRKCRLGLISPVAILMTLSCFSLLFGQQQFTPQWHPGQNWLIQTQYFQYYQKNETQGNVPSQSIRWQFVVVREEPEQFVVEVRSPDIPPEVWMELFVNKITMSVERSVLHYVARDEPREIISEFPGQGMVPQFAQVGQAPCQMPYFPLEQQDSLTYQRDIEADEEVFEVTFQQQVQQFENPAIIRELVAARLPVYIEVPDVPRFFLVQTQQDEAQVEQVWAETLPWYFLSINTSSISWLVEYSDE
jgi:hypothetical protein